MVTKIGSGRRQHLYIEEWMRERGLNYESLGRRMDKGRTTVWRWAQEQHRLRPEKQAAIAHALGLEGPDDLWRPPSPKTRPSLDNMVRDVPDDLHETIVDVVSRLARRAS